MSHQLAVRASGSSIRPGVDYGLGALLAFGALNAFAGGYFGTAGAEGVPTEWLEGTTAVGALLILLLAALIRRRERREIDRSKEASS